VHSVATWFYRLKQEGTADQLAKGYTGPCLDCRGLDHGTQLYLGITSADSGRSLYSIYFASTLTARSICAERLWLPHKMAHSLMVLAIRFIAIMFFTGLIGCVLVVIISWISIFGDGFSNSGTTGTDSH
jgi:hypothetical protein